jgi:hypothetical protein
MLVSTQISRGLPSSARKWWRQSRSVPLVDHFSLSKVDVDIGVKKKLAHLGMEKENKQ